MFDIFIIVDWSAASVPRFGRDSIWACWHAAGRETLANPPTRHVAKALIGEWLQAACDKGQKVLLGFDFPFGYPAGFAARLGLPGPPWRAVWDEITRLLHDHENNENNRFEVGAEFNRRISKSCFPFWGCPVGFKHEFLGPKHHRRHDHAGLREKRLIDCRMAGAQPCWKLAYTGSVGSQSLTGIPVVRQLRDDPRWSDRARIWPFETGLLPPDDAKLVFAEVWPSWWKARKELGPPNDKAQVRTVAGIFEKSDQTGELATWFYGDPALAPAERLQVEREEAWTLGVTAPRQRLTSGSSQIGTATLPAPHGSRERREGGGDDAGSGEENGYMRRSSAVSAYLKDPAAIARRSFALVRAETDLARFPPRLRHIAARIAHAVGDVAILDSLAWSKRAAAAGVAALAAGAPVLVDAEMVAAGISRANLTAANKVLCFLGDPAVPAVAAALRTTRSAAAVELWRPHLAGALVVIGSAPTALFRLLEILAEGAARPAVILGFPVGFVGAAEAKAALAAFGSGIEFITLHGRRGGSAIAAAAVNALARRR